MTTRREALKTMAGAAAVPMVLGAGAANSHGQAESAYSIMPGVDWTPPRSLGLIGPVDVAVSEHCAFTRNALAIRVMARGSTHERFRTAYLPEGTYLAKLIEFPRMALHDAAALAKLRRMLDDPAGFHVVLPGSQIAAMNWQFYA